ncbi:MAG: hypothetical protein M8872_13735, partial [marine benthic group bacterium]|nr:hypothetical protein [Gemmatimonadota bacterium]
MNAEKPASDRRRVAFDGLAEEEIRAQLARILAHPEFEATERLRRFLVYIVEESLAGGAAGIKGRVIARRVFGRGEDFDPNRDPVVRIEAGRLRRRLQHYYLSAGGQDPVRIEIPKGRYVPRFTRQLQAHTEPASSNDRAGRLPTDQGPTIAVLPFRDLTGDPEQLFFVNGLVDELVNEVNLYENVTAVPCQPPPGAATDSGGLLRVEEIGARFLLEGSVRRDPTELKMSVQLTDAVAVRQVWGTSYKIPLETVSLIATQEELARDVMAAIAGEYGVIARRLTRESRQKPPSELDTYDALLRYHHYMLVMTPEAGDQALRALRRATDQEPDYGPTWAALATLHTHAWIFDLPGFENPLETALEYARRGASLAPASQLARTILAYVHLLSGELERFREEAEIALALNPGSPNFSG